MRWLLLFLAIFLSSCASNNPVVATIDAAWHDDGAHAQLRAGFEYLKVELNGRTRYMALGTRRRQPHVVDEDWYSASREMIHLHNGRIVQAVPRNRIYLLLRKVRLCD
jgi:hypothetical protein